MDGEQWQQAMDIEQNATEPLHGNPYCSNGGTHRGRRVPNVTIQPQWSGHFSEVSLIPWKKKAPILPVLNSTYMNIQFFDTLMKRDVNSHCELGSHV
ncbi:uncharacterized protein LOC124244361 isoform X2 [Equus quagga]|uniref:uncharacterized protein LOC124244361 isoform X2 n=1 Tax=Equus quagga TaxID=89248 RepID=UPI001EE17F1B|nr:uncharacterized protein LOC124244361 isoform X2 [Equus quagga]